MKEPDKIYIEIDNKAHVYFGLQPENAVEYIRKNYLLEWAKREKAKLLKEKPTYVWAGINLGIDKLISKLNQM